jgi:ferric-dicitrate binding protein FerR (iron transport regulator)
MKRPDSEIDAFIEGQLTAEDAAVLDAWIAADPANASTFLQLIRTHQALRDIGHEARLTREAERVEADGLDLATLHVLARQEASAQEVPFASVHEPLANKVQEVEASRRTSDLYVTLNDLAWASGKAGRYLLRSKAFVAGSLAAAVLLSLLLLSPWDDEASDPITVPEIADASPGDTDAQALRTAPRTVARLTASDNAVWAKQTAEGASAPGSQLTIGTPLHPGTRLTLTAGFAEITTNDGAIAILEAPATIELLDNDNALKLHSGKLVGICETDASKGFIVRTPHMDITDLGTRFGVTVHSDRIETTVFAGEVLAKPSSGKARRITHSQTARLDLNRPEQTLIVDSRVAQGYVQQVPRPSLITDATLNLKGFALRVMPQGMQEDAKLFTDRDYEVNGIDETGIPAFLVGGDLVMMPSDARPEINPVVGERLKVEVEVSQPAEIYLLIEQSRKNGLWLERDYVKTEFMVGNDRISPDLSHESLGVGPGVSIDRHFEVWKRKEPITQRTVVGEAIDGTMYAIVARPLSNDNDLPN